MANIKSAKKRVLVSQAKADRNKSARSKVKTYIKKVESAVAQVIRQLLRLQLLRLSP